MSTERSPASEPSYKGSYTFGIPVSERFRDPAGYVPSKELDAAVKVALWLGMPLLLTGGPGCGKTSIAAWLSRKLELPDPLVFNVKSSSSGRDLLYEFDEMARFRDAQAHQPMEDKTKYLRLNALGRAILLSSKANRRSDGSGPLGPGDERHPLAQAIGTKGVPGELFGQRHIVLIDELDKAPRDTPNDLLLEILDMRFQIRELDTWVVGDPSLRPVVVITSNSEKSLPEPFLRRCVFHHIEPPNDAARRDIVNRRMHPFAQRGDSFDHAMQLFDRLCDELGRSPGTSELLAWLMVLEQRWVAMSAQGATISLHALAADTLGALAKTTEDLTRAGNVLAQFEPVAKVG